MSALEGQRVVVTRPAHQAESFAAALRAVGATPILFPTIQIAPIVDFAPLDYALLHLAEYDWLVFTSTNGVQIAVERMAVLGLTRARFPTTRIAAIGPATANTLDKAGLHADLVPPEYVAESLFNVLNNTVALTGRRVLLLRASEARPALLTLLRTAGAIVTQVDLYNTVRGAPPPEVFAELNNAIDTVTFTSPLTVRYFAELLGADAASIARGTLAATIGPITAQALQQSALPFRAQITARRYTTAGLIDALLAAYP